MKLSEYAKQQGISYRTALRWWKAGQIPGFQAATGTIIVQEPPASGSAPQRVAVYARVFSHEHQATLDRQAEPLGAHFAAKGYQVSRVGDEVATGVDDDLTKSLVHFDVRTSAVTAIEHDAKLARVR